MTAKLRSWWQKNKQLLIIFGIVIIVLIIAFALAVYWFGWDWTGFNKSIGPELKSNQQYRPEKTLWDWMQLLLVPIILAIGGFWLNQLQKNREERAAERRDKTEHEIAADNQREVALQGYLDKMSELLLKEHLGELTPDGKLKPEYEEVRRIARVRTLTVLPRLDPTRKKSVLQFLKESNLIEIRGWEGTRTGDAIRFLQESGRDKLVIDLHEADLSKAELSYASLAGAFLILVNLSFANLMGAYLEEAVLGGANLHAANLLFARLAEANLSEADLSGADLSGANLSRADLSGANLSRAKLNGAYLGEADLSGADLHEANLGELILTDGTKLGDAVLKGATGITIEELEKQAKSLKGAIMPDGTKHP